MHVSEITGLCFLDKNFTISEKFCETFKYVSIQLFRESLSEKVHATIPKGIVGGFKFTVLQRNLKEWQ